MGLGWSTAMPLEAAGQCSYAIISATDPKATFVSDEERRSMDIYEYVAVLTSIVIGLSITQLLYGLAQIVQHPGREPVYWAHLVWVAYMVFTVVWWWWWQIALSSVEVWSLGLYLYVIVFPVILYFLCALLFPEDMDDYDGYRDYFLSRRKWFFGLLGAA